MGESNQALVQHLIYKLLFIVLAFSAPCHAQCEQVLSGPVPLFWDANTEVNIDFYNVFRAESSSSTPVFLFTVPQAADPISTFDSSPILVAYYTVTAVNVNGRSSGPSNTLCVTSVQSPSVPTGFVVIPDFSTTPLVISNLNRYQLGAITGIADGEPIYQDRTYTYFLVPISVQGAAYIITANNDKRSTTSSFLTFDISREATVYIAHDDSLTLKPGWLADFSDTGENLNVIAVRVATFSLFSKFFPSGQVVLGGNRNPATAGSSFSMYGVIVK